MIKTYVSVITVYLPSIQQLNSYFQTLLRGLAFLISKLTLFGFKLNLARSLVYQKQVIPSPAIISFLRLPITFFWLVSFLFIGPHTSVLANWEEKVIPDKYQFISQQITDQVTAVEVPKFSLPVNEIYISTYFSRWHQGIDLPNPYGSSVHPITKGKVVFAGWSPLGYGNLVIVRHELGFESLYAHLSEISIQEGSEVNHESVLGNVGATGLASGNHLHLEIHQNGAAINPLVLFR